MVGVTLGLIAGCIGMIGLSMKPMRVFHKELALLPEGGNQKGGFQHPILGVNLPLLLPLPDEVKGKPAIVVVADPKCRTCKDELYELIRARKADRLPAVCYYEHEEVDLDILEPFIRRYAGQVPMIPIPDEWVAKLGIEESPFVCMIDGNGVVVRVQRPLKLLVEYYRRVYHASKAI